MEITEIKEELKKIPNFIKNKKVVNIFIITIFILLLIGTSWIRLQNLPLLKDSTTGEYIPIALDPFYFLRIAESINEGGLPTYDLMRYPSLQVGFSSEILPQTVVLFYKFVNIFDKEVTLQYIFVISPVIFFILGLIAFFFLILALTKSKWTALISSIFLAVIPTYLYRTMAGFADHESIGMFAFFLALVCYCISLNYLDKQSSSIKNSILFGIFLGFVSAFTIACWGGISNFLFMVIPLSFGIIWLIKSKDLKNLDIKLLFNFLIFYLIWFLSSIIFGLLFGFGLSFILGTVTLSLSSLINGGVLLFIIVDFCIIKFRKFLINEKLKKYRVFLSTFFSIVFGGIFLFIYGTNILALIPTILTKLLHPFGAQRIGLTVAENLQPYLTDWFSGFGKLFFWIFYIGTIFVGFEISKGIGKNKNKILFSLFWIFMISGILFSRISATSNFNGINFISNLFYGGSLILFFGYCIYLYFNDDLKIENGLIITASLLLFMLIAGRGAIRLLFVITPFICFMAGYSVVKLFEYLKESKDEILKLCLLTFSILVLVGLLFSFFNFTNTIMNQAKYTGPSANYQWQGSMDWVRENTAEDSIFVHWWDYGYWVEYLGERASLTDGGHACGFWDHLVGRYVLTTPFPETALSFMKTHDISYLLIDSTDIGKYPAYSKIGSGEFGEDRFEGIPIMQSDPEQIVESSDGVTFIYMGGAMINEDLIYEINGTETFLPSKKTAIIGIILEIKTIENKFLIEQPIGVFVYNNQQIKIPMRYLYYHKEIIDFGGGVDSIISIIPRVLQSNQEIQIDDFGTAIYLSPKVSKSLFAQLYLLDDVFNNYPTLKMVHSEQEISVIELNNQGANLDELIYFNGLRGPIKIWEVNYPKNVLEREEFLKTTGKYADFDDLAFIK